MKVKNLVFASLTLALGLGVAASALNKQAVKEVRATGPYTVYIVSANNNWLDWNNRFVLGDGYNGGHWSNPTASPIDSDFDDGDATNFNKAKIGNTVYNFQKVTISDLLTGNWLTVQKYNSTGSAWEANGYNGENNDFFDGANSVINGTNNVIYVAEYSGRPWLNNAWEIPGWFYKVKLLSGQSGNAKIETSLQVAGSYTPADPTAPSGYAFAGWYRDSACTSTPYNGTISGDTTLYAKFVLDNPLSAPVISKNGNVISWSNISGNNGYRIYVGGVTTDLAANTTSYTVNTNRLGTHDIKVMALGDNVSHTNSQYSNTVQITVGSAYYLVGSFNGWNTSGDHGEYKATTVDGVHTVFITTNEPNVTAKLVKFDTPVKWYTPNQSTDNLPYPVEVDGGDIKFVNAGTYTLTISNCNDETEHADYSVSVSSPYRVTIGETTVSMDSIARDGNDQQYRAHVNSVSAGDNISFLNGAAAQPATAQGGEGNNVDVINNKLLNGVAGGVDVYLKYKDSAWSYYVTGRSALFYLSIWPDFHPFVVNSQAPEGNYMYTGIELAAGTEFKLYCAGYFAPTKEAGTLYVDGGLDFDSDGIKITCNKTGIYNLFIDNTGENAVLSITGQSAADLIASTFAEAFLGLFENGHGHSGICQGDGSTSAALVATTWASAKSNYDTNVKGQSGDKLDATNILKTADPAAETLYGRFAALYDTVFRNYGIQSELENFASRNVTALHAPIVLLQNANDMLSINLIAVLASLILATSSITLFVIKRKRTSR